MSNKKFSENMLKMVFDTVDRTKMGYYVIDGDAEYKGSSLVISVLSGGFLGLGFYNLPDDTEFLLMSPEGIPFATINFYDFCKYDEVESAEVLGQIIGCWWEDFGAREECEEIHQKMLKICQSLQDLEKCVDKVIPKKPKTEPSVMDVLNGLDDLISDVIEAVMDDSSFTQ